MFIFQNSNAVTSRFKKSHGVALELVYRAEILCKSSGAPADGGQEQLALQKMRAVFARCTTCRPLRERNIMCRTMTAPKFGLSWVHQKSPPTPTPTKRPSCAKAKMKIKDTLLPDPGRYRPETYDFRRNLTVGTLPRTPPGEGGQE